MAHEIDQGNLPVYANAQVADDHNYLGHEASDPDIQEAPADAVTVPGERASEQELETLFIN